MRTKRSSARLLRKLDRAGQPTANGNNHNRLSLPDALETFQNCSDLQQRSLPEIQTDLVYFAHLVGKDEFERDVLTPLSNVKANEVEQLLARSHYTEVFDSRELVQGILDGKAAIFHNNRVWLVDVYGPRSRNIQPTETETVITGPHDSFVESIATNLSLIRRRIKSSDLKSIKMEVGEVTRTDVYLMYIEGIANLDYVDKLVKRIEAIEIDSVYDGNMIVQYIDDHPTSLFPQFLTTERPDSVASKLSSGKVIGFVDGSPSAFVAPTSFFEFFSSPDDYYQRWALGTALRLLRFLAFLITISFTAFYVSVTTFHYEMIPQTLLLNLTESRSRVPFPPLYEAILMETTIELLREAGARLPSKIGQTIGIVGGIVIGQAAVQAGLTSNILIIAVATSAIASFVIPSYIMSASIRVLRFGLIILAGIWGNLGLMFGVGLIAIHLAGLTNLGSSYLSPVAPMKVKDWNDIFIRAPYWILRYRPSNVKTRNQNKNKMRL